MAEELSLSKDEIIRRIHTLVRQMQLRSGEEIGTERALADKLGITRSALRPALSTMECNHEITRRIGRNGGIIVTDGKLIRNINTIESLPEIARRQGLLLESKVATSNMSVAGPMDIRQLQLDEDSSVIRINRLRFLDGEPFCLEQTTLPAALFPHLLMDDSYAKSLYGTFHSRYSIDVVSSDEVLEVVDADFSHASLLSQPEGAPLVKVQRIASDALGRIVEKSEDLFVASKIRFTMHSTGYVRLSAAAQKSEGTNRHMRHAGD